MISPRRVLATSVPLALAATLAACGGDSAGKVQEGPLGDEPITPGAIAAIVTEHLPEEAGTPSTGQGFNDTDRDGVGLTMRLIRDDDASYDGDYFVVGVGAIPEVPDCEDAAEDFDGCEAHAGGLLMWDNEEPEEDPGVYSVIIRKHDGVWASAYYAGDEITDDPRTSDLSVPVDVMVALLKDPALDETTSQEWIDRGEEIDWIDEVSDR